jgi:uncharacterized RDD family membrane protein YckC
VTAMMQCAVAVQKNFTAAVILAMPEFSHATYFTHNFQYIITALPLFLIFYSMMQSPGKAFMVRIQTADQQQVPLTQILMIRHNGYITCSEGVSLNKY